MVFASICEHASIMLIFASTSSCQIFLVSSEHFRKIQIASSEHVEYFELLRKFSASRFLSFINKKRYFAVTVNNRAETFKLE